MSRSRKKNPFTSTTCSGAKTGNMHAWKRINQGRWRAAVREAIANGGEVIPELLEVTDEWTSPADGKTYWDEEEYYRK